jgi:hypothetical protein
MYASVECSENLSSFSIDCSPDGFSYNTLSDRLIEEMQHTLNYFFAIYHLIYLTLNSQRADIILLPSRQRIEGTSAEKYTIELFALLFI